MHSIRPILSAMRRHFLYSRPMAIYILRFGNDPYVWLKREAPTITWGPERQAQRFESDSEARRAIARLGNYRPLEAIEIEEA